MIGIKRKISKATAGLIFCILLILFVRLAFLLFPSELLFAEPSETFRGVLAEQIVSGDPVGSFFDYLYNPYAGGSIVVSFLAVPFFLIFGETIFSLKLVGVLFSLFSLILIFKLIYRHFGLKAALLAGLMFALPNQYISQRSSMAIGDYCEAIFFSLMLTHVFFKTINPSSADGKLKDAPPRYHFLFGLAAGFGIWFHYVVGIALIACLFTRLFIDEGYFTKKHFKISSLGFIIGFLPWVYFNLTRNFQGFIAGRDYIWTHFFRGGLGHALNRLFATITADLPGALMFKNSLLDQGFVFFFSRAYYFIFVFAFFGLAWRFRERIKPVFTDFFQKSLRGNPQGDFVFVIFVLLYLVVFVLIYSFFAIPTTITGVGFHDYRRLMTVFPFAIMAIAIFFSPYISFKKNKYPLLTFIFTLFFLSFGILSNAPLLSIKNFAKAFKMRGYSYRLLGWNIADSSLSDIARWVEVIRGKKIANLDQICEGMGEGVGDDLGDDITLEKLKIYQGLLHRLDGPCLKRIYYGMGIGATRAEKYNAIALDKVIDAVSAEYLEDFKQGYNAAIKNESDK